MENCEMIYSRPNFIGSCYVQTVYLLFKMISGNAIDYKLYIYSELYCSKYIKNLRNVLLACPVLLTFSFNIVGCDITVNLPSVLGENVALKYHHYFTLHYSIYE